MNQFLQEKINLIKNLKICNASFKIFMERVCHFLIDTNPLMTTLELFGKLFILVQKSLLFGNAQKEYLLSIVQKNLQIANDNQQRLYLVLRWAAEYGYLGDDCIQSAEFVASRIVDTEKQQSSNRIRIEVDNIRKFLEEEKQSHEKNNQTKNQKIYQLGES